MAQRKYKAKYEASGLWGCSGVTGWDGWFILAGRVTLKVN